MRIDFVSDVACPWCAVGLNALERALDQLGEDVAVELHFQPFELNPDMPAAGTDAATYLKGKYGMTDEQLAHNRGVLRDRGAAVGFAFGERGHVWNTFDAHRLLHLAGLEGQPAEAQRALKHALLKAYHGESRNPGAREVLLEAAAGAGLDVSAAAEVFDSGRYADEVRQAEQFWQQVGIRSVPSVVIDRAHLIQGGQPPEVFVQALRQIASASPR
ncbi:MAG: DsbA family oxidoreductase [Rubrivivax sp.]|nr:DsbA family oxidoreductase [Rubrivivax sp.]